MFLSDGVEFFAPLQGLCGSCWVLAGGHGVDEKWFGGVVEFGGE